MGSQGREPGGECQGDGILKCGTVSAQSGAVHNSCKSIRGVESCGLVGWSGFCVRVQQI